MAIEIGAPRKVSELPYQNTPNPKSSGLNPGSMSEILREQLKGLDVSRV